MSEKEKGTSSSSNSTPPLCCVETTIVDSVDCASSDSNTREGEQETHDEEDSRGARKPRPAPRVAGKFLSNVVHVAGSRQEGSVPQVGTRSPSDLTAHYQHVSPENGSRTLDKNCLKLTAPSTAKVGEMYDEGRLCDDTTFQTSSSKGEKASRKDMYKKKLPRMANIGEDYSLNGNEEPDQVSKKHVEAMVGQRQEDTADPSTICKKKLPTMANVGEAYSLNENDKPDQVSKMHEETPMGSQHQEDTAALAATTLPTDAGDAHDLERGRSTFFDELDRVLAIETPPDSSEAAPPAGHHFNTGCNIEAAEATGP